MAVKNYNWHTDFCDIFCLWPPSSSV